MSIISEDKRLMRIIAELEKSLSRSIPALDQKLTDIAGVIAGRDFDIAGFERFKPRLTDIKKFNINTEIMNNINNIVISFDSSDVFLGIAKFESKLREIKMMANVHVVFSKKSVVFFAPII